MEKVLLTTIEDLFEFVEKENIDLSSDQILVLSKDDSFNRIWNIAITSPKTKTQTIITEDGNSLSASKDHQVWKFPGKWYHLNKLKIGNSIWTKNGFSSIQYIKKDKIKFDLYDLEVDDEQYFTNGILSHNSTISDSLKLGFFGKIPNKTLKEIPNRKNGHGEIHLKFTHTSGKNIEINRRFSPSSLEVLIDGEEFSLSKKNDIEKYIEDELLDINSYVFSNMISLSLNDFKSFLKMTPSDKRKIIDKIFSLSIYNDMKEKVKEKMRNLENEISTSERNINFIDRTIENTLNGIETLNNKIDKEKDLKILQFNESLNKVNENLNLIEPAIEKLETSIKELKSKSSEIEKELNQLTWDGRTIEKSLKLYENEQCPTCETALTTKDHIHKKDELQKDLDKISKDKEKIESNNKEIKDKLNSIVEKYSNFNNKKIELNSKKRQLNERILEISKDDSFSEIKTLNEILEKNKEEKETASLKVNSNKNKKKLLNIVNDVVGDDGVKSIVISNIVPLINRFINEYLEKFNIPFTIKFDENFNSNISQYGNEISSETLSTGESKIVDFCVLIAMIKILKIKYMNLNVLFLDEIFASLDADNSNFVVRILKDLKTEFKLNIFVIHHAHLQKEHFDNCIEVTKISNHSNFEYNPKNKEIV